MHRARDRDQRLVTGAAVDACVERMCMESPVGLRIEHLYIFCIVSLFLRYGFAAVGSSIMTRGKRGKKREAGRGGWG